MGPRRVTHILVVSAMGGNLMMNVSWHSCEDALDTLTLSTFHDIQHQGKARIVILPLIRRFLFQEPL